MSFFTEWDFYYIPKTDFNPKWINYKYKLKKLYDHECISPKAQTADKQWCNAHKVIAGIYNCSDCNGSGWSLWGSKCWRSKMGCYNSGTYSYNSLCYNEQSACKPEMILHKDDFHCNTNWNIRDLNYYEVADTSSCSCTGACEYGAKRVCTYDKTVFDVLGGIGSTKIVKSVTLVCQDKDNIYCDELRKTFRVRIQLSKIKTWDFLDKLKTVLNNMNTSYDHINYLNFIGYTIMEFYLMMNVPSTKSAEELLRTYASYVPLFLVLNKSSDPALIDVVVNKTTTRNYSLNFYSPTTRKYSCTLQYPCIFPQKTLQKTFVTLSGAVPQSTLSIPSIGSQGMFLVQPIQFCINKEVYYNNRYDNMPKYKEGDPIIYLVYYDMANIKDQERNLLQELKNKYLDNATIASSPCRVWNSYVYYNHILPNICYDVEIDSSYCNKIMNYDASPPAPIAQKCSLLTSNRFPDCKTFLMTDIEREQPKANPTRTYDRIKSLQGTFCTKYDTLECQCLNRASKSSYQLFENSYGFPMDSKGNAGCWYKPCMDDPTTNILIDKEMRSDFRNCPKTVCENIISVVNRPENSVSMSNLDLRTSCYILSTATPKPKLPTTTPLPEEEQEEQNIITSSPPEEETPDSNLIPEEDIQLSYTKVYVVSIIYVILFIIFVSYFVIYLLALQTYGIGAILLIVFFLVVISILLFFLRQNLRLLFRTSVVVD